MSRKNADNTGQLEWSQFLHDLLAFYDTDDLKGRTVSEAQEHFLGVEPSEVENYTNFYHLTNNLAQSTTATGTKAGYRYKTTDLGRKQMQALAAEMQQVRNLSTQV